MTPSRIELLQAMPIFGAIGEAALGFLLARARSVAVARGECFFRQGDAAQSMFVLESGSVEICRGVGGRERLVRHLEAGDCFGEMALLDLHPRSATIRALEDCRAIELASADLHALYEHDLEAFALIQMNLAREMSRRLRATDELLFLSRAEALPASSAAAAEAPPPGSAT
jgi:CRP-like cAMP-binding protein